MQPKKGEENDCVRTQHEHNVKSIFNTYINNYAYILSERIVII